jgi:hypothetical protein
MWFWPVNEMTELVSGTTTPQFRGRIFASARMRAGSRSRRFLCFALIDVRCFRVLPKIFSNTPGGASVLQVKHYWYSVCRSPLGPNGYRQLFPPVRTSVA